MLDWISEPLHFREAMPPFQLSRKLILFHAIKSSINCWRQQSDFWFIDEIQINSGLIEWHGLLYNVNWLENIIPDSIIQSQFNSEMNSVNWRHSVSGMNLLELNGLNLDWIYRNDCFLKLLHSIRTSIQVFLSSFYLQLYCYNNPKLMRLSIQT